MTEAEKITQEMMAAYSTSIRFGLDTVNETKPVIFDPPREGTINETNRAKAVLRNFNQKRPNRPWSGPPQLNSYGGSITYDPSIGTRFRVLGSGHIEFDSTNPNYGAYKARSFPGGGNNTKAQAVNYRLGQHLGIRPRGSVIATSPLGAARSRLYRMGTAGAIQAENPSQSFDTRTLINRGGNFQPFNQGKFGKSIPRMTVLGQMSAGLNRIASADPPIVRPGGIVPGRVLQGASQSTYVTPTMRVVPGGGARDMGLSQLAMPGAQQSLRDNTPQKVARREQLRLQRSSGTDVDNRPSQGSNLDMKAIKREVKRAEIIVEFDKAFAKARRQGKQEFTWRGKQYNTRLK